MVTSPYEWKNLEWDDQLQTNKQTNKTFKYVCLGPAQSKKIIFVVERRECHQITLMNLVRTKSLPCSSEKEERPRRSFICQIGVVRSYSLVAICLVWVKADLFCLERPKMIQKVFPIWNLITYSGGKDLLESNTSLQVLESHKYTVNFSIINFCDNK